MKLVKISLTAAVALGALSTASFAQPLEEAIKGVDVSGYLRYRYNDDQFENAGGTKGDSKGKTTHQYRALANFKAPVANNVAMNLGVLYMNEGATVNGKGEGLGAGSDGQFGVSTFYATFTPDNTKTTIMVGKQLADTPITNAGDFDRGTGVLAVNSDVPNWTFVAGAFDTYAIQDNSTTKFGSTGGSITEALYLAAAIAKYGDFAAQMWFFNSNNIVDSLYYLNATYKMNVENVAMNVGNVALGFKVEYATSDLAVKKGEMFYGGVEKNDLYKLEADVAVKPVKWTLGYLGNTKDNYLVSLDKGGKIITSSTMGSVWWLGNNMTSTSIGAFKNKIPNDGIKDELSVFYTNVAWDALSNLNLALTYVNGESEASKNGGYITREFQEITPMATYKYSKNLTLSGFYAMLKTDKKTSLPGTGKVKEDEKYDRFRFQALYRF